MCGQRVNIFADYMCSLCANIFVYWYTFFTCGVSIHLACATRVAVGGGANIALVNYHDLVVCADHARFKSVNKAFSEMRCTFIFHTNPNLNI